MPLVRIDLNAGGAASRPGQIADVVYRAMHDTLAVPPDDRFVIVNEQPRSAMQHTPSYLGIRYSPNLVIVQITLSQGRSVEQKQAFYRRLADDLSAALSIDRQDVFINLVEVVKENWSFGNGEAQYVT